MEKKMSRHTSSLSRIERVAQMSIQEEIIARKKLEIIEKQKTAELAKQVVAAQVGTVQDAAKVRREKPVQVKPSVIIEEPPPPKNSFNNDGSFFENFKKITEAAKKAQEINKPPEARPEETIAPTSEPTTDATDVAQSTEMSAEDKTIIAELIQDASSVLCAKPPPPPPPEPEQPISKLPPPPALPILIAPFIDPIEPEDTNIPSSDSPKNSDKKTSENRKSRDSHTRSSSRNRNSRSSRSLSPNESKSRYSRDRDYNKKATNQGGNSQKFNRDNRNNRNSSRNSRNSSNRFSQNNDNSASGNNNNSSTTSQIPSLLNLTPLNPYLDDESSFSGGKFSKDEKPANRFGKNEGNKFNTDKPNRFNQQQKSSRFDDNKTNRFDDKKSSRFDKQDQESGNRFSKQDSGDDMVATNRFSQDQQFKNRFDQNSNNSSNQRFSGQEDRKFNRFNQQDAPTKFADNDDRFSQPFPPQDNNSNKFPNSDKQFPNNSFVAPPEQINRFAPQLSFSSQQDSSNNRFNAQDLNQFNYASNQMPNRFGQSDSFSDDQSNNRFGQQNDQNVNQSFNRFDQKDQNINQSFNRFDQKDQNVNQSFNRFDQNAKSFTGPNFASNMSTETMVPNSNKFGGPLASAQPFNRFSQDSAERANNFETDVPAAKPYVNPFRTITPQTTNLPFNAPPPIPAFSNPQQYPPLHTIPPPMPLSLNKIPPPRELDLNAIPEPTMNLDAIKIPEFSKVFSDHEFIPTSVESLVELVAENGDEYEDKLCLRNIDMHSSLWFLSEKRSLAYRNYRQKVMDARYSNDKPSNLNNSGSNDNDDDKYDPEEMYDDYKEDIDERIMFNNDVASDQQQQQQRNNDDDDYDSDSEYLRKSKETNFVNLKRKLDNQNSYYSSDEDKDERIFMNNPLSQPSPFVMQPQQQPRSTTDSNQTQREKKKRSRWGDKVVDVPQTIPIDIMTSFGNQQKPMLTSITRNDPALLQYARQNYGSTNLSEEDWRKCEDHFKINLLFQDMLKKRQEIDRLANSGRFKYEYDSDEDVTGGTWEHKLRTAEMEATTVWAEALNKQSEGKHHIGDFLPPEELKKFMEKYDSQQNNREPDISDYKEYKLKEDNIGFKMLQKLGWKAGQGLGSDGAGIVDPVNKAQQRDSNQGLGATTASVPDFEDNEYDAYRKRMMLAYRFRPNPMNNPRRAYY